MKLEADSTGSKQPPTSEPGLIKVWGLWLKRETDFIALAAFVLAAGAAIFQTCNYLRGPEVQLFSPDSILAVARNYPTTKDGFVRLEAVMSYINSALPGYNGVLRRETVSYSLDGRDYAQTWNEFVDSANGAPGQIDFKNRRPSKPLPILAASGTSHETLFWPIEVICPKDDQKCDRWANFVQWKTFLDTLRKSLKDGKSQIEFDLVGQIFPKQDLKVVCTVDISEEVVDALQRDGWHQLLCDESH